MTTACSKQKTLILFIYYTMKHSWVHVLSLLIVPALLAVFLFLCVVFLKDPKNISIPSPIKYQKPDYDGSSHLFIEVTPVSDLTNSLCAELQISCKYRCVTTDRLTPQTYRPGAFQALASSIAQDIQEPFNTTKFVQYEQSYIQYHGYSTTQQQQQPLVQIQISDDQTNITYNVSFNDDVITSSHRKRIMKQEADYSDVMSAQYFSIFGTQLQNRLDHFLAGQITARYSRNSSVPLLGVAPLPSSSVLKQSQWQIGYFTSFIPQAFSSALLGNVLYQFRYAWLAKRLGINDAQFWLTIYVVGFFLNFLSLLICSLTCKFIGALPFAAFTGWSSVVICLLQSLNIPAFIVFLIVLIERYNVLLVVVSIISLSFSVFPVMMTIFCTIPKSLWDDSFAPNQLTIFVTLNMPILLNYGLTELMLFTVDENSLLSYQKYSKQLIKYSQIQNTDWVQIHFQRALNVGTYQIKGVWYYVATASIQCIILLFAAIWASYCKSEEKQFGLPMWCFFDKQFWKNENSIVVKTDNCISIKKLQKSYDKKEVLKEINFSLKNNSICGLIGASSSGKTTLLNIIAGYFNFTKNGKTRVKIFGNDISNPYTRLRMLERISICPQDKINMFDKLTISENISILRQKYAISENEVQEYLSLLNLNYSTSKTFGQLSGGMQRRFALLISLLQRPDVLLLDEMTANVDPLLKRNIWNAIQVFQQKNQCCIIIASHDTNDIINIADQVAFLDKGIIKSQGSIASYIAKKQHLKLIINNNADIAIAALITNNIQYYVQWNKKQTEILVHIRDNKEFEKLAQVMSQFMHEQEYYIVSSPINETFYQEEEFSRSLSRSESESSFADKEWGKLYRQLENPEEGTQRRKKTNDGDYITSAILAKVYEGLQRRYVVYLICLAIIVVVVVLQVFIMNSLNNNPHEISQEYYQLVRKQSFQTFYQQCTKDNINVEQQIYECLTSNRERLFSQNTAVLKPGLQYNMNPQKYLNVISFDSLEDYSFKFGHNSLFLSEYGDNYHVFIVSKNIPLINQTEIQMGQQHGYKTDQNGYQYHIPSDALEYIYNVSKVPEYFDSRLATKGNALHSTTNYLVSENLQEVINDYVFYQWNNYLNVSTSNITHQQLLEIEERNLLGIMDIDAHTVYIQLPYYKLGKLYQGTDTQLNDTNVTNFQYYRHPTPILNGPWYVDSDPVYPVSYTNDLITKGYNYYIRKAVEANFSREELYNDVYIQGTYKSMPKFLSNHILSSEYVEQYYNAYYSLQYFIPLVYCFISIVCLRHIHKYVESSQLAFINGISISMFNYIFSKICVEIITYSSLIYILFLLQFWFRPSEVYSNWQLWLCPILYSGQIVCFMFVLEVVLQNYSVCCLYLGISTIALVIINPIMQTELTYSMIFTLFIPGFYYVNYPVKLMNNQQSTCAYLIAGIGISFVESLIIIGLKYYTTIKNSMRVKHNTSSDALLTAKNVTAYYSKKSTILHNFNLQIKPQQIVCLAGSNGCGKSTFTKCLTGYQVHYTGQIEVNAKIGIVPQDDCFDTDLTVLQNMQKFTCFSGLSAKEICTSVGLDQYLNTKSKDLSAGLARILTISLVLASNPQLLILDEVTVGLDYNMKKQVWKSILNQKCSILIITHDMLEIEALCDYICIFQNGKIVSQDSLQNTLLRAQEGYILTVYNQAVADPQIDKMEDFSIKRFEQNQNLQTVMSYIRENQIAYQNWYLEKVSMENVFLNIIGVK